MEGAGRWVVYVWYLGRVGGPGTGVNDGGGYGPPTTEVLRPEKEEAHRRRGRRRGLLRSRPYFPPEGADGRGSYESAVDAPPRLK